MQLMRPNAHSTLMETHTLTRLHRPHLPTTVKMVEEAILALNSHRGFSLYKLKKYISEKYQLGLNPRRNNLIRTHLRAQLVDGTLINVSGKGLTGRMRVAAKTKKSVTSNTIATEKQQSEGQNGSADATFVAAKRKKAVGKTKGANKSTSGSQARTPPNKIAQPLLIPDAPQRNSMTGHAHLEAGGGTPCSSGGRVGRKRKLLPPPLEYIALSQEY
uniref:Histone H1, gonadal n=1 Tax=Bactrocera dorsalis TaxID=27457 RepID=A0A034WAL2_BACDO